MQELCLRFLGSAACAYSETGCLVPQRTCSVHLAAQESLLACEAHLDHVVVVLQEALQLVPHSLHTRAQALVPRLDPPHAFQVLRDDLQGQLLKCVDGSEAAGLVMHSDPQAEPHGVGALRLERSKHVTLGCHHISDGLQGQRLVKVHKRHASRVFLMTCRHSLAMWEVQGP